MLELPNNRWATIALSLLAGVLTAVAFPPFGFLPGLLGYGLLMRLWDRAGEPRRVSVTLAHGFHPFPSSSSGLTRGSDGPQPSWWSRVLASGRFSPDPRVKPEDDEDGGTTKTNQALKPLRSAFWRGWLAGFAFFFIAMWWVYEAFQVDAANQGWMAPFAVVLLAAGMGLFWGVAGLLYRWLNPVGPVRVLIFAGVFCLIEWTRGHVLTGLPWDLAGETWKAGSAPSQAASVFGAYGLGWITVAAGAALTLAIEPGRKRETWIGAGLGAAAIAGLYLFGATRLAHPAPIVADAPVIRVVQPNEQEQPTYDADAFRSIVERYVKLTALPAARAPDAVIWPEGAIPDSVNDYMAPGAWTRTAIEGALKPGQSLLMGGYRVQGPPDHPAYFNTLVVERQTSAGLVQTAAYDKYRLVPFGEYMPLDSIMGRLGIKKLVHVGDGFSVGPRPAPIHPAGLPPVQPLICYESLFPGLAREGGKTPGGRAAWIVNVSDDAWFGRTYGPLQHLNLASYRAIEEGLPIVRATPTGVSAVIDAYGRIRPGASLGQGAIGVIDLPLPPALSPTLFSRAGESLFYLMMAGSAALAVIARVRGRAPF